jgi:hypothetical protein
MVKVMRARADRPGAMNGECWVLTDVPEQPSEQMWWLTLGTCTSARMWRSGPFCWHGRGLVGHMSGRGQRARSAGLTMGLMVWDSKPPSAMNGGFW